MTIVCSAVLILLFASVSSRSQVKEFDWTTWGAVTDTVSSVTVGQRITLRFPFVLAGSDSVYVDDVLLARDLYVIDYQRGVLRFKEPLKRAARVEIKYVHLPFYLKSVYSLRGVSYSNSREPKEVIRPFEQEVQTERMSLPRSLKFGGMKSISFSVGSNQGVTLNQTLHATIAGNITPTIQVKALLSDENLPIQPEGNTEELEYLDKVFVEISAEKAKVSLGDLTLSNRYSTFSPFSRQVKGVSGQADVKGTNVLLAGASSKGVFRSVVFRGTEGLQGPYELLSQARITLEVVIAGTEKVYMDGELLKRGQNRDYVMDYDRGTITFTPRRLVTPDSEISVDFEVSQESYDRAVVVAGLQREKLPGGFHLHFLFAREKDDANRPKRVSLGSEDLRILKDSGDNAESALGSGVSQVEPGKGNYLLVPEDTLGGVPQHYEYSDSQGNYELVFTEVGDDHGDYVIDGISKEGRPIYKYAGEGAGNYVVGKKLPLPESAELFTFRVARERDSRLGFDLEYNLSNYDKNTLSPLEDKDNVGGAGVLGASLNDLGIGAGALSFEAIVSTMDDKFKSLDKPRPSYFYKDWNLENEILKGREVIGELATTFSRGKTLRAGYSIGRIDRELFSGNKHEGNFSYNISGDRNAHGRIFATEVQKEGEIRTRHHQDYDLGFGVWKLVPSAFLSQEEYFKQAAAAADSGWSYHLYRFALKQRMQRRFNYALSFENRDTDEISSTAGAWVDARRDKTFTAALESHASGRLKGELQYTHRSEDNFILEDRRTSDLARAKGTLKLMRIGMRTDVDYEISQNQARTMKKNVIFVGDGKGDYNVLGEPVGKGRGEYMLVLLPTTNLIPTHKVDFTLRLSLGKSVRYVSQPSRGIFSWIKNNVSFDQTLSVKEETTYDETWKVYLLIPSALQRDGSTIFGVTSLRQDWSLLDSYKNASLIYRYQRTDKEDNLLQDASEEEFYEEHSLKFDRSLSQALTTTLELGREVRKRGGRELPVGTGSVYNVAGWSFSGGGGVRFSAGSTFDGTLGFTNNKDRVSGFEEKLITFKPRIVVRVSKAATLFGNYELSRSLGSEGEGIKPIFFSSEGTTHRWSLTGNLHLSKAISLVTTYHGRSERSFLGKTIIEHNLKVETRAFF